MLAALTHADLSTVELVLGILLLCWAAYLASEHRIPAAPIVAVIGVLLILLAS